MLDCFFKKGKGQFFPQIEDGIIKIITLQQFCCGCFCRIAMQHVRMDLTLGLGFNMAG